MLLYGDNDMDAASISGNNPCVSKPLHLNTAVSVDSEYWSIYLFDMGLVEETSIVFSGNHTPIDII